MANLHNSKPTAPQTHYDPDSQTTTPSPPDPNVKLAAQIVLDLIVPIVSLLLELPRIYMVRIYCGL
ncbi:hypothetical protein CFP56_025494 [Quercus suber]|uniref:Uncharacterized protein n=1 Tax=Quercus suber TaxID=58331 RepID=A0AAW0LXU1_QUESU